MIMRMYARVVVRSINIKGRSLHTPQIHTLKELSIGSSNTMVVSVQKIIV